MKFHWTWNGGEAECGVVHVQILHAGHHWNRAGQRVGNCLRFHTPSPLRAGRCVNLRVLSGNLIEAASLFLLPFRFHLALVFLLLSFHQMHVFSLLFPALYSSAAGFWLKNSSALRNILLLHTIRPIRQSCSISKFPRWSLSFSLLSIISPSLSLIFPSLSFYLILSIFFFVVFL